MKFKLILAFIDSGLSDRLMDAAREAGATGATVIANARGEGLEKARGIFGLELSAQRDVLLFLVEAYRSRRVLERIAEVGSFDDTSGTGIALQIDVEDALGVRHQMEQLAWQVEQEI